MVGLSTDGIRRGGAGVTSAAYSVQRCSKLLSVVRQPSTVNIHHMGSDGMEQIKTKLSHCSRFFLKREGNFCVSRHRLENDQEELEVRPGPAGLYQVWI